jgi:predicted Zn-dependent protease
VPHTHDQPGGRDRLDRQCADRQRFGRQRRRCRLSQRRRGESLYTTAMRADAADPVLPFNLGNVFQAEGRATEAKVAWQIAVARDPAFAEAWYNLAVAAEDDKQTDLAIALCRMKTQQEWAQTG